MIASQYQVASRRVNGLERPFHSLQVVTWAIFPLLLLHFYSFLAPILWPDTYIILHIIFSLLAALAAVSAYVTCAIDPVDNAVCSRPRDVSNNETNPATKSKFLFGDCIPCIKNSTDLTPHVITESIYCHLCETRVHTSAKHCTHCRKCVNRFDHHCKWLNTCIGSKNYRYFLSTVASVALLTSFSLAISMAYVIETFATFNKMQSRIDHARSNRNFALDLIGTEVISVISVAILFPLVSLVYQLAGFHTMLVYRGLTTYEYIVAEQKRQREKARRVPVTTPAPSSGPSTSFLRSNPQPKPPVPPVNNAVIPSRLNDDTTSMEISAVEVNAKLSKAEGNQYNFTSLNQEADEETGRSREEKELNGPSEDSEAYDVELVWEGSTSGNVAVVDRSMSEEERQV